MGGKESKQFPLPPEEALKRVNETEKRRLQDAFRRLSSANGLISKSAFIHDVLGDGVPLQQAEQIYALASSTTTMSAPSSSVTSSSAAASSSSASSYSSANPSSPSKGLTFREVIAVLVLITRGTHEEKIKFIYGLLASNNGSYIEKADMLRLVTSWESGYDPAISELFAEGDRAGFEVFSRWIETHPDSLGVSRWLLSPNDNLSLINKLDTPTFYQTLAGVTHLEESEIVELEKRFWSLSGNSTSGQITLDIIRPLVSPPLPESLVPALFNALDENKDGHIDFKELSCGVSAACRGPELERQKFVFKMFDEDCDGVLNRNEVKRMIDVMVHIRGQITSEAKKQTNIADLVEDALANKDVLSVQDFLVWTVTNNNPYAAEFSRLLYQLCHVCLGLRPLTRREEGEIVRGWIEREERGPLVPGAIWHLVAMDWWTNWHAYVNYHTPEVTEHNSASRNKKLNSTLAMNNTGSVIATGYTQLLDHSQSHAQNQAVPQQQLSKKTTGNVNPPTRPGPIDNSSLVQSPTYRVSTLTGEGGKLKPKVIRGKDFELIPERLWKALVQWYGEGGVALPRQVIRNSSGVIEFELNPLSIKIFKHQTSPRGGTSNVHIPSVIGGGYSAAAAAAAALPTTARRHHAHQAAFSRRTTLGQILEFLSNRLSVKQEDMRLWFYRDDTNMKLLEDEFNLALEDIGFLDDDGILVEIRSRDGTWPEEISSLMCNDIEAGNHRRKPSTMTTPGLKGVTGLNNLGNTCYMNASLQCVSHTKILAEYFNSNCHLFELNRSNPLGMKGHIAKRFGDLVRDMWSGDSRSIAPIKLRWTIGRYRPHFSGFQQQDSQELLAFLLDGLHEDLNRVTDKPYTELKDSAGRPDDEVAFEAWESHVMRNKSIIVDLFHGQLKSKVTCKVCGHESARFDPFTYLSLPLPMESSVHLEVIVIRQDGSTPVKYGLTLDMDARYSSIRTHLSRLCKIPPHNLILVDIVQAQFRVTPNEEQKLKNLNGSCIFAYEFYSNQRLTGGPTSTDSNTQTFSDIQRSVSSAKSKPECSGIRENGVVSNENHSEGQKHDCQKLLVDHSMEAKEDPSSSSTSSSTASSSLQIPPTSSIGLGNGSCHSRQGSNVTNCSSPDGYYDLGDCHQGIIVGLHRKMIPQESYFLSTQKYRPALFGLPLIVNCNENTTYQDLYKSVWVQVSRLVSPLPPRDSSQNHATDCDDSLGYEYPFVLKVVQKGGAWCGWCPWHRFCRGCSLPCTSQEFAYASSFLAIDWEQTALHLRYLAAQEKAFEEDPSVQESLRAATEPITLAKCLTAFTREEELGPDEKYYCSSCKTHQLALKKLQIWRLPPILIVHLKRFHYLNGRWIKSHKIVDFPSESFEPENYLAAVPATTLARHKELLKRKNQRKSSTSKLKCNGTIVESDENGTLRGGGGGGGGVGGVDPPYQRLLPNGNCGSDEDDDDQGDDDVFKGCDDDDDKDCCGDADGGGGGKHRTRQVSTSLQSLPIRDDNLRDFHEHRLVQGKDPLDIKYNVYAMVCHSGVLGGGHYTSYCKHTNGKWFFNNDSACKEVSEDQIDKSTAYMLFYERNGLSTEAYLPKVSGSVPNTQDLDEELDQDFKKQCCVS